MMYCAYSLESQFIDRQPSEQWSNKHLEQADQCFARRELPPELAKLECALVQPFSRIYSQE